MIKFLNTKNREGDELEGLTRLLRDKKSKIKKTKKKHEGPLTRLLRE